MTVFTMIGLNVVRLHESVNVTVASWVAGRGVLLSLGSSIRFTANILLTVLSISIIMI